MDIFDKLITVRSKGKCIVCGKENQVLMIDWFTNSIDIKNHTFSINTCLSCHDKIDKQMSGIEEPEDDEWWKT